MENKTSSQLPQAEDTSKHPLQDSAQIHNQPSDEKLTRPSEESLAKKVNRYTAFILLFSGIAFVLIAILSIWEVFGPNAGDIVWRSLGSLGAIALGAMIVSVASRLVEQNSHK